MIIRQFNVKNYRSLKKVNLQNIGNFNIIVGKNSSGKTNLMEAIWLFLKDFQLVPEIITINSPLPANELMWFDGSTDNPITFLVEIEFGENEYKNIFSQDFIEVFKDQQGRITLEITRNLVATPPKYVLEND